MKIGMRKPSLKKSIKARTTGRLKRSVKRAVNPLYGKKGMGYINNPKKAVYNKVYNKTTFGVNDLTPPKTSRKKSISNYSPNYQYSRLTYKICGIIAIILAAFCTLCGFAMFLFFIPAVVLFLLGIWWIKIAKEIANSGDE